MKSIIEGFFMAWGNFSVIPCPYKVWTDRGKKWMLTFMPFVGIIIGLINLFVVSLWLRFSLLHAILILSSISFLLPHLLTGFIHLDGFMDCCDAILSRRDIQTKQRILKDSTVGAFSVISLVAIFLLGISASYTIFLNDEPIKDMSSMVFISFLARNLASRDVQRLKVMSVSQYAYKNEDVQKKEAVRVSIFLMVVILALGFTLSYVLGFYKQYTFAIIVVFLIQKLVRYKAVKDLGGMNGDIAGYSIVISEVAGLVTLAMI